MPDDNGGAYEFGTAQSGGFSVHRSAAMRSKPRHRKNSGRVRVTRVPVAAWRIALRLAGGDPRRLRVVSPDEVIVTNHPRGDLR